MTKIEGTVENWENGSLGQDEQFARQASPEETAAILRAAGVQPSPSRLQRGTNSQLEEARKSDFKSD